MRGEDISQYLMQSSHNSTSMSTQPKHRSRKQELEEVNRCPSGDDVPYVVSNFHAGGEHLDKHMLFLATLKECGHKLRDFLLVKNYSAHHPPRRDRIKFRFGIASIFYPHTVRMIETREKLLRLALKLLDRAVSTVPGNALGHWTAGVLEDSKSDVGDSSGRLKSETPEERSDVVVKTEDHQEVTASNSSEDSGDDDSGDDDSSVDSYVSDLDWDHYYRRRNLESIEHDAAKALTKARNKGMDMIEPWKAFRAAAQAVRDFDIERENEMMEYDGIRLS